MAEAAAITVEGVPVRDAPALAPVPVEEEPVVLSKILIRRALPQTAANIKVVKALTAML